MGSAQWRSSIATTSRLFAASSSRRIRTASNVRCCRISGGNSDGRIDAKDAVYARLRLWRDENHDGVSHAAELRSLASADVVRMRLDYKESKRTDEYGNRFRYRAKVDDAKGLKVGRWAWDVFLLSKP